LAEQVEPAGMQVLDDGSHVQLAPEKRFHGRVAHLVQPAGLPADARLSRRLINVC
jgi:hypothetical protein